MVPADHLPPESALNGVETGQLQRPVRVGLIDGSERTLNGLQGLFGGGEVTALDHFGVAEPRLPEVERLTVVHGSIVAHLNDCSYVQTGMYPDHVRWPWTRKPEQRAYSVADPAVAELLGFVGFGHNASGVAVSEHTALTLSAVWRSVSLIAGTTASLPLRTLRTNPDGTRERTGSFLDNPGGDRMTPFEWKETVLLHLLLHGNAYLQHVYNGAGAIAGLYPIHPLAVTVEEDLRVPGGKKFSVQLGDGTRREFDADTLTHIPGLCGDGIKGMSPIQFARNSFGTSIAGERSAARMFRNGALVSGIVTPEEDLDEDQAKAVKESLASTMMGEEHAGDIAVVSTKLKFQQWSLSAQDAQFLQSRTFQVEEVGRWYGIPPHLLGQTEKSTSWGTGIEEQNRGLARYTLTPWTTRIEQRLSRLLTSSRIVEFDYSALLQPSPEDEITLLIEQVNAGLLTPDEARRIRNLPPLKNGLGNLPRIPTASSEPARSGPDDPYDSGGS